MLSRARSVCAATPPSTRLPLAGSNPTCPAVNTMRAPPASGTIWPWLYGPMALGASGTLTACFMVRLPALFDRDALREIAGLVHVAAAQHGDVIGQQLERNHREHGLQGR